MKKKINFVETMLDIVIPRKGGIYVVETEHKATNQCPVVMRYLSKTKSAWSVVREEDRLYYYCRSNFMDRGNHKCVAKEEFINILRLDYPQDYELVLWHPEILEARYHRD